MTKSCFALGFFILTGLASVGDDELLAHMEAMGMPKSMLAELTDEQKQQMRQMIQQDPKQQVNQTHCQT